MKFKLTESVGYNFTPDDPELELYDLELDINDVYNALIERFGVEKVASILADNGFLKQEDVDSGEYELDGLIYDCLLDDMDIYDVRNIYEFEDIIEDLMSEEENLLSQQIEEDKYFRATHGPEI